MTRLKTLQHSILVLILSAATGCDNVEWGGAELAVVPPPPKAQAESAPEVDAPLNERLPEGPVLYHVRMTASGVPLLTPVGEIAGDTLAHLGGAEDWELYGGRFIAAHLRQGTEFTIFHEGVRAGTFVVRDAALPDSNACPRLPRATGYHAPRATPCRPATSIAG